jgi:hypothetical protein
MKVKGWNRIRSIDVEDAGVCMEMCYLYLYLCEQLYVSYTVSLLNLHTFKNYIRNTSYHKNFVKYQKLEMPEGLQILLSIFNFSHILDKVRY